MNDFRILCAAAGLLAVLIGGAATAQETGRDVERFDRALREAERSYLLEPHRDLMLGERIAFDYGGVVSYNFFAIDDIEQETHIFRETDVALWASLNIDGVHEFYGRLRYDHLDFNEGDSFDGLGDEYGYPISDRWWYKLDLGRAVDSSSGGRPWWDAEVKIGRQYVKWGSGLVYSDDLYAVRPQVRLGKWVLEGLAGMTPKSTVIDFDSSRSSFHKDTDREVYAGMIAYEGFANHRPYFYALHQEDQNDEDFDVYTPVTVGFLAVPFPTKTEYDSTYFAIGSTGNLSPKITYEIEGIYERGRGLSSSVASTSPAAPATQTREDIEAWAGTLELAYHLHDEHRTQLEFQTLVATGDDDRLLHTSNTFGGNLSGTDDQAFNAFGYANTGAAFAAPISNLLMFRLGASAYPLPEGSLKRRRLHVGVDWFIFNKLDSDAPFDEATSDDRYLGMEADIWARWRITSDVALNVRYGVFFPGEAIETDHDTRHFLFTGISYSF